MFAVAVELLADRYAATAYNDRERVEWPPHPARFFSALVATWADDEPRSDVGIAERAALEWLERQSPPDILADLEEHAGIRTVVPVFVPVNDEFEVAVVERAALDEAELAASSSEEQARERALKSLPKLRKRFADDHQKAIAIPSKLGKESRAGLRVLPDHRGRQPRTFPVACPATPRFTFIWRDANPETSTARALAGLLARLVRLGHSSCFVHATITDESTIAAQSALPRYRPDDEHGIHAIRWVAPGQLARLGREFDLHHELEPRVLPARFVRYTHGHESEVRNVVPSSLFESEFVVLKRTAGARLPITSVAGLARQFRRALMSCADQPVDSMISGHRDDGSPSDIAHAAIVPLPFVGSEHADGTVLGVAIVLPRDASTAGRHSVARALVAMERRGTAADGDAPEIRLELGSEPLFLSRTVWATDLYTLMTARWTRPARRWVTATPIALDRNPGDLHDPDPERRRVAFAEATRSVADSVEMLGLPSPIEIDVVRSCVLAGTEKPRSYPRFPTDRNRIQRVLVHARLMFAEPIRGPLLLGAGRYHGLGLCLPVVEGNRPA